MVKREGTSRPSSDRASTTSGYNSIAPARAVMTTRAGLWATREVGAEVHTVAYVAGQLGVGWHTVMDAVSFWAAPLIEDPDRVGKTEAVGVDETKYLAATRDTPTQWSYNRMLWMLGRLRARRTLPFDHSTSPPVAAGGEGYANAEASS